jgi:hypothetical protein
MEYLEIRKAVIEACKKAYATKWAEQLNQNWLCAMYLDYVNDYICISSQYEREIEPLLPASILDGDVMTRSTARDIHKALVNLASNICHINAASTIEDNCKAVEKLIESY